LRKRIPLQERGGSKASDKRNLKEGRGGGREGPRKSDERGGEMLGEKKRRERFARGGGGGVWKKLKNFGKRKSYLGEVLKRGSKKRMGVRGGWRLH